MTTPTNFTHSMSIPCRNLSEVPMFPALLGSGAVHHPPKGSSQITAAWTGWQQSGLCPPHPRARPLSPGPSTPAQQRCALLTWHCWQSGYSQDTPKYTTKAWNPCSCAVWQLLQQAVTPSESAGQQPCGEWCLCPQQAGHSHLPPLSHCQQHLAGQHRKALQSRPFSLPPPCLLFFLGIHQIFASFCF